MVAANEKHIDIMVTDITVAKDQLVQPKKLLCLNNKKPYSNPIVDSASGSID